MNPYNKIQQQVCLITLAIGLFINSNLAQHADIEGDTRIIGKLNITNAIGDSSIFIGVGAGSQNQHNAITSDGVFNTFLGTYAGKSNTLGSRNTFMGYESGLSNGLGSRNTFIGYTAGRENVEGSNNSFFGSRAGMDNDEGSGNAFFGTSAGESNTVEDDNTFMGYWAGKNSSGSQNSYFGSRAGRENTGFDNEFFGFASGMHNEASYNSFFGSEAGRNTTLGEANSFFGTETGWSNTTCELNSFFGTFSGYLNSTGDGNSFFGYSSGDGNQSGFQNTYLGYYTGADLESNSRSTFIGARSGNYDTADSLDRSIAIGYDAKVNCHHCAVIGGTGSNSVRLGIGVIAPSTSLHVKGNTDYDLLRLNYEQHSNGGFIFSSRGSSGTELKELVVNNKENGRLILSTNDKEIVYLSPDERVGIGNDSPATKLHITETGETTARISNTSTDAINIDLIRNENNGTNRDWRITNNTSGVFQIGYHGSDLSNNAPSMVVGLSPSRFSPESNGSVDLGTDSNRWETLYITNGVNNSSDRRLKKNIQVIPYGLSTLKKLNPVTYQWMSGSQEEKLGVNCPGGPHRNTRGSQHLFRT